MLEQGWQVFLGHPDVAGVARLPVDGRVPQGAAAEKCGNITNDVTDDRSLNFLFFWNPIFCLGLLNSIGQKRVLAPFDDQRCMYIESWQIKKEFSSKIQRKDEKCLIWTCFSVEPGGLWGHHPNPASSAQVKRNSNRSILYFHLPTNNVKSRHVYYKKSSITQIQLPPHIL